jgi:hypothetical protein
MSSISLINNNFNKYNIPIIILVGRKLTGKTTLANYLKMKYPNSVELTFADPLKKISKELFLLSDDQLNNQILKEQVDLRYGISPRIIFQRVGDLFRDYLPIVLPELKLELKSNINNNPKIFSQNLIYRIKELIENDNHPSLIIVSDCRLIDEHISIKTFSNSHSIKLIRKTGSNDLHSSELVDFDTDYTIYNNEDIDKLFTKINKIIFRIK